MTRHERDIFDPNESLDALYWRLNHPKVRQAAEVTVDAVMISLRERGEAALAECDCQRRLSEMSVAQVNNVIERLDRLRPKYPAITDDLLLQITGLIS